MSAPEEVRVAFDAGHALGFACGVGWAGGEKAERMKAGEVITPTAHVADKAWASWQSAWKGDTSKWLSAFEARMRADERERQAMALENEARRQLEMGDMELDEGGHIGMAKIHNLRAEHLTEAARIVRLSPEPTP